MHKPPPTFFLALHHSAKQHHPNALLAATFISTMLRSLMSL